MMVLIFRVATVSAETVGFLAGAGGLSQFLRQAGDWLIFRPVLRNLMQTPDGRKMCLSPLVHKNGTVPFGVPVSASPG